MKNGACHFLHLPGVQYATIIVLGFLLYAKTLSYQLVYLDDNVWIEDYGWLLKNLANALSLFTKPDLITGIFYRPLLNLSFMIDAQWAGNGYAAYHFTNILIHLVNGCLVLMLLKKLRYDAAAAFVLALVYTVHPVLVSGVAWIPGRTDSLLAMMALLSVIQFIRYLDTRRVMALALHILCWIAALLVKETAVGVPVICLLYWFLISSPRKTDQITFPLVLWGFMAGVWLWIRSAFLPQAKSIAASNALPSLAKNSPAIVSYLGKVMLPVNLSVLPVNADTTLVFGWIVLILLVVVVALSKNRRMNFVLFGVLWFVIFLVPSLFLSFLNHEYRLYLPMIGCMIVFLETDLLCNVFDHPIKRAVMAGIAIVFAVTTFVYSDKFHDRWVYWQSAVSSSPHSPLAHRNLGAINHLQGNIAIAEQEYKKALELNPREPMAHNNLGLIYADHQQYKEAEIEYLSEIAINPDYDNVYFNLGVLYFNQERWEFAETTWKKVLLLNNNYIGVYFPLAQLYLHQKKYAQAAWCRDQLQKRQAPVPAELTEALVKAGY